MYRVPRPPEWPVNTSFDQRVLDRVRAEYLEMPGLKLRIEQVQRLCGIEQTMCQLALDALVKANFLCLKSDGTYVRLTEGSSPLPRPAKAVLNSLVMTWTWPNSPPLSKCDSAARVCSVFG